MAPLGLQLTSDEVHALAESPGPTDVDTEFGRLRLSSSVKPSATGEPYLLQVGVSLAPLEVTLTRYRDLLLWSVPAGLVLAGLACWWLSAFALRPLARVAAAAGRIDVATLERRLPVRGAGDELDDVAGAFNDTLGRLERAVGEMRQFSAALAHELRTPLAALRGQIELALRSPESNPTQRDTFGNQLEEIDRLARLIDQILTLARAEAGQIRMARAPVDVAALAASLVEQLEPVAAEKSIALTATPSPQAMVEGDAGWLQRLVLNLLDNAVKYTGRGGTIRVEVTQDGPVVHCAVHDTGVGLSPEHASHVFDRFYRADPARSSSAAGVGLGVSLVQWIAQQHRGTVAVGKAPDKGTIFTVTLPSLPPRA
jgi:heavy metal sensor kinase